MFQSYAFQSYAFQTVGTGKQEAISPSGGLNYHPSLYEQSRQELRRKLLEDDHAELKRINEEIAEAEQRQIAAQKRAKAKLLANNAAKKLAALETSLQDEISALRIERLRLIRQIDDEAAVLLLLMSLPFH